MKTKKVWALYFSPTGTTKKIVSAVAGRLGSDFQEVDVTLPKSRENSLAFSREDLVLVAMPTYAGKLPNKILPYLKERLQGGGAMAAAIVTFGNRSYDNSLAELRDVLLEKGFKVIGGGAFACRHAFTDELAFGRPNFLDIDEAEGFGLSLHKKIQSGDLVCPEMPGDGDAPYYVPKGEDGQPVKFLKAKPQVDLGKCSRCGACARRCPMGAIDKEDITQVPGTCIKCQACVRCCTRGARYFDDQQFLSHVRMLEENYEVDDKVNEIYI